MEKSNPDHKELRSPVPKLDTVEQISMLESSLERSWERAEKVVLKNLNTIKKVNERYCYAQQHINIQQETILDELLSSLEKGVKKRDNTMMRTVD